MKLALILLARDKAKHVRRAALALLAQEGCEPLEVVLSDQGSTDGTRQILDEVAGAYRAERPHFMRRIDCPHTADRGMAGFNAHLAWAIGETSADWIAVFSADDFALPDHARTLLDAIEAHPEADMVATGELFMKPDEPVEKARRTAWQQEGWVSVAACVQHQVGGSSAMAWKRSFWEKVGPCPGIAGCDVYLPPLAAALGGFWFVNAITYVYVEHADVQNMGLGGVLAAQTKREERLQTIEHMSFQVGSGWRLALKKLVELRAGTENDRAALGNAAWRRFATWADTRTEMTMRRIAPLAFPI